jgi:hypothetical protein
MREPPFDTLLDAPYKLSIKTLRKGSKKGVGKMEKTSGNTLSGTRIDKPQVEPTRFQ